MSLVLPGQISTLAIDLLKSRHDEHLAALERQLGYPTHIEALATVDLLAGEGFTLRSDTPPAVLLGVFGFGQPPQVNKHRRLDLTWMLAFELTVVGTDRADTLTRRDIYTMSVIECLLARLPRKSSPIDSLTLTDVDYGSGSTDEKVQRTLGQAHVVFDVLIRDSVDLNVLPTDDSAIAPGAAGGPPADTYTPPVPWPTVASAQSTVQRVPITEEP